MSKTPIEALERNVHALAPYAGNRLCVTAQLSRDLRGKQRDIGLDVICKHLANNLGAMLANRLKPVFTGMDYAKETHMMTCWMFTDEELAALCRELLDEGVHLYHRTMVAPR